MATLFFFVGNPGSGKTTVADHICTATGAVHIWADRERHAMFRAPTHSKTESEELYTHLNAKTSELLAAGYDVVFDTNFNYRKDRDTMRAIAHNAGADVVIIKMVTPEATARSRALHGSHAERNGMAETMPGETFERIVNHREQLGADEPHVDLDGRELSRQQTLIALDLQ